MYLLYTTLVRSIDGDMVEYNIENKQSTIMNKFNNHTEIAQ